ncbi:MAG: hypothetical protein Q7S66_01490 [bacterium]|nr:hypothetical protein [bacterium]
MNTPSIFQGKYPLSQRKILPFFIWAWIVTAVLSLEGIFFARDVADTRSFFSFTVGLNHQRAPLVFVVLTVVALAVWWGYYFLVRNHVQTISVAFSLLLFVGLAFGIVKGTYIEDYYHDGQTVWNTKILNLTDELVFSPKGNPTGFQVSYSLQIPQGLLYTSVGVPQPTFERYSYEERHRGIYPGNPEYQNRLDSDCDFGCYNTKTTITPTPLNSGAIDIDGGVTQYLPEIESGVVYQVALRYVPKYFDEKNNCINKEPFPKENPRTFENQGLNKHYALEFLGLQNGTFDPKIESLYFWSSDNYGLRSSYNFLDTESVPTHHTYSPQEFFKSIMKETGGKFCP